MQHATAARRDRVSAELYSGEMPAQHDAGHATYNVISRHSTPACSVTCAVQRAAFAPRSCETSFLDGGLRANSVKAAKDCVIAVISSEALALLNSQNSLVGYQLMKNISTFEPSSLCLFTRARAPPVAMLDSGNAIRLRGDCSGYSRVTVGRLRPALRLARCGLQTEGVHVRSVDAMRVMRRKATAALLRARAG